MASRARLSSDPEYLLEYMHDLPDESDSDEDFDGYLDPDDGPVIQLPAGLSLVLPTRRARARTDGHGVPAATTQPLPLSAFRTQPLPLSALPYAG